MKQTSDFKFKTIKKLLDQFHQKISTSDTIPNTTESVQIPKNICMLNFNYTNISKKYFDDIVNEKKIYIPIHGQLQTESGKYQEPVFGFGDEKDEDYSRFENLRNDELFKHIKSFKYLQYSNYKKLIDFIESAPYQVQIFGHSCGLSDRTLLSSIFENNNCISIKPFYFKDINGDDYEEKSYSIARHFRSKAEFRLKVVNKEYCEPMFQPLNN